MMARATKTKTETAPGDLDDGESKGELAVFQPARLPYHPAIEERFGVDKGQWKVLVEAIFPAAKTVDAIVMALSYCKLRHLDPFKRPVHIVPMWDSARGGMVETVWPGISELRTTASRTKGYAGVDEAQFGKDVTTVFEDRIRDGSSWKTEKIEVTHPEWCRLTVYRIVDGQRCMFVGPKVAWLETYATIGKSSIPNKMWQERPEGQLEKCAEAAALRRAFPEELGSEMTAEEMIGRHVQELPPAVEGTIVDASRDTAPPRDPAKAAPSTASQPEQASGAPAQDGPPKAAPKADPISSGPQRDAAPPRAAPAAPPEKDSGPTRTGTEPHAIPGKDHTYASWCAKYCDLIQTSPDTATVYKWIDLNQGALAKLQKGMPSEYHKAKTCAEKTMEALRDAQEKAETKAAKKAAPPPSDMDDGPGDQSGPMDPESVLKRIETELAAVEDPDNLQETWDRACEPLLKDLFPPDQDEAQAIYNRHEKRLGGD